MDISFGDGVDSGIIVRSREIQEEKHVDEEERQWRAKIVVQMWTR